MQSLDINPLEALLFRDGKPFSMGESHLANSIFPPKPSVFAGFLRSRYFIENFQTDEIATLNNIKEYIGEGDKNYGKLKINAIFLKKSDVLYLPTPLDLVQDKDTKKLTILKPMDVNGISFSNDLYDKIKQFPMPDKNFQFIEDVNGFIDLQSLSTYLSGRVDKISVLKRNDFVESEYRTGIKIGVGNVTEEGKLYSVEFLRFNKDTGFKILFDGLNYKQKNGIYYIGGEKKQVIYEIKDNDNINSLLKNEEINKIKEDIKKQKIFKILFLTPCYSDSIEPKKLSEKLSGKASFLSACIKTEDVGGFDIAANKPKKMKKLISAGSVLYYNLDDINSIDEIMKLNFSSVSDEQEGAGFGIILIGGNNDIQNT